jgi:hypothetical protein
MAFTHNGTSRVTSRLSPAPKIGVFCEEKIVLVANYAAAMTAYVAAVTQLEKGMIRASREVYAERRRLVEVARIVCDAALKELDDHVSGDCC